MAIGHPPNFAKKGVRLSTSLNLQLLLFQAWLDRENLNRGAGGVKGDLKNMSFSCRSPAAGKTSLLEKIQKFIFEATAVGSSEMIDKQQIYFGDRVAFAEKDITLFKTFYSC